MKSGKGGRIMTKMTIIRVLDEETFFIDAGHSSCIKPHQFIEVLNAKHSYKNLAQVVDVYDDYALCRKLGSNRVFFGDVIQPRQ